MGRSSYSRLLAAIALGLGLAAPAFAQTPAPGSAGNGPPLPQLVATDAAGVDLLNGGRVGTDSVVSIGAADAPALQLSEGGGGFDGTPLGGFHYTEGSYPYFSDFFVLEIHAWTLQNRMSHQFSSASDIAQHVEQNYTDLNKRFIPPEHVE